MEHIGIAGGIASGKTTVSKIFEDFGFSIISLSDFIKKEIETNGMAMNSRDIFFETANAMRKMKGNHIIAQMAVDTILREKLQCFVIEGIRVVEEVTFLRKTFNDFFLIGLETPFKKRLQRIQESRRGIDHSQKDRILKDIIRENSDGSEGCQLNLVFKMCNVHINGDLSLREIKDKCHQIVTSKL